jgi:hypothetical protein
MKRSRETDGNKIQRKKNKNLALILSFDVLKMSLKTFAEFI